jgi:hypothetical protein
VVSKRGSGLFAAGSKRMPVARIPALVKPPLLFSYGHNQGLILEKVNGSISIYLL